MDSLTEFVGKERRNYEGMDNNSFAFAFSQVTRYYVFLRMVYTRYEAASEKLRENTRLAVKQSSGPMSPEGLKLLDEAGGLVNALHLEIESFYLFATILLDRIACFIEWYFGKRKIGRIDSHRKLKNGMAEYANEKALILPAGFSANAVALEQDVAEYRDKQITHDKSSRTMRATVFDGDGAARIAKMKLFPREGDKQVEGKNIKELLAALDEYAKQLVTLIETNRDRTWLPAAPRSK